MMQCPVSLQPFKNPKVLPCGHTLDSASIKCLLKKVCPLCQSAFSSLSVLPTNWIVVQHLNLVVPQSSEPGKDCFVAEQKALAMKQRRGRVEAIFEKNMHRVMDRIARRSLQGMGQLAYGMVFPWCCFTPVIIKHEATRIVIQKLREMGFLARSSGTQTHNIWIEWL